MVLHMRVFLFIVAALYVNIFSYSIALPGEKGKIYGVKIYSYPKDYTPLFEQWKWMHINTVFASEELLADSSFRERARYHGIATFLIAPIFFNPDLLHKDSSLYALTEKGKPAIDDWVEFVCPSRVEYRKEIITYVSDRVKKYQPDGLSIDFIRFFVFWEMVYPDQTIRTMHNTCFCPTCLKKFQNAMHTAIPRQLKSIPEKSRMDSETCDETVYEMEVRSYQLHGQADRSGSKKSKTRYPCQSPCSPLESPGF